MYALFRKRRIKRFEEYSYGSGTLNKRLRNQRGDQELTIQINWQQCIHKTQDEDKLSKKHNAICVAHHHTQDTKRSHPMLKT